MPNYKTVIARLEQARRNLPDVVGAVMVEHATDNIRSGGFEGTPHTPRKPGSVRDRGRQILVDTGDGLRSIHYTKTKPFVNVVVIDYMAAHNEGARIQGTQNVKSHTRRPRDRRPHRVRAHTREVDFELPQRPFILNTPLLRAKIVKAGSALLTKAFQ